MLDNLSSVDVLGVCVSRLETKAPEACSSTGVLDQPEEQLGPGWPAPSRFREEEEDSEMQGALQSDSWVSLAGGPLLACHLCLLPV